MAPIIQPKSILVLTKYRFIGDTLLAVPLLRAINRTWPQAQVTLLTGGPACELLQGCPYVKSTIEFDPYRAQDKGLGRFLEVARKISRGNYDLAIVCNRSFHSALLAFLGGVTERVGWANFQGRDFMLTRTIAYGPNDPEQLSYLSLLEPLGVEYKPDTELDLWVSDDERNQIKAKLPESAGPVIAIQPGASHSEKQWRAENYAELMSKLSAEVPSVYFVLFGGPGERDVAAELTSLLTPEIAASTTNLVGQLSLRQTLAAITYVQLFIGGDTAIRHSACALKTPSIALFGPTSVLKWGNATPPSQIVLQAPTGVVTDILVRDVVNASMETLTLNNVKRDLSMA